MRILTEKNFISNYTAFIISAAFLVLSGCTGKESSTMPGNLVPAEPGASPDYWCTWAAQNYMHGQGAEELDPIVMLVSGIGRYHADYLTEKTLFGPEGWAATFHPRVRNDLYIVLDDGWDIPVNNDMTYRSLCRLDPEKFPSFTGDFAGNLKQLNQWARDHGWRGIGLWFRDVESPQDDARRKQMNDDRAYERLYWGERLEWCREAGIDYWKMDVGGNDEKMRFFQDLVREKHPGLHFEIGVIPQSGPFNSIPGDGYIEAGYCENAVEKAMYADIVRLYDISPELGSSTTLERFAHVAEAASVNPDADALLNCDDEVYIAAVLGGTMGILRHSMVGRRPGNDPDIYLTGPRHLKKRNDEVARAVRWQRIAPAFPANALEVRIDEHELMDSWKFAPGEFWASAEDWKSTANVADKTVEQYAPARVTRGIPLPEVRIEGEPPFVIACRHPNGAVAVAAIGRISPEKGYYTPEADIMLDVGAVTGPVGVFGYYRSLTLVFNEPLRKVRVLAQDLAGDEASDITRQVKVEGNRLVIPGAVIMTTGLSAAQSGDLSDPGMVMVIKQQ